MSSPPPTLPPGPEAGVLAQTVAFHRDPLRFLSRQQASFGDVFTLRLLTARPTFVVAEPAAVEFLLEADPEHARAGAARRAVLPFASPHSVFGGDGERHRAARGRIAEAMSARTLEPRRPEMARIAARHAAGWPRGRPFKLLSRVRTLADEIFVRLVLGVHDEEVAGSLTAAIGRMLRTPGNPPVTLPGKGDGLAGELGQLLFERRQAGVAEQLSRAIAARRAEGSGQIDVLGCMVAADPALGDEEIVDELMSLLMAAQEPPSIALAWLLDRLCRDPALAAGFLADPGGAFAAAVTRETLRLRPPASASCASCANRCRPEAGRFPPARRCWSRPPSSIAIPRPSPLPTGSSSRGGCPARRPPGPTSRSGVAGGAASARRSPTPRSRPSCRRCSARSASSPWQPSPSGWSSGRRFWSPSAACSSGPARPAGLVERRARRVAAGIAADADIDRAPEAIRGYAPPSERPPLLSYAMLSTLFGTLLGTGLAVAQRTGRELPERMAPADLLLVGVAAHKLSRLVSKDKVTSPLRAPFTELEEPGGPSELEERARGSGIRKAIGELLICPY